jgi:Bacteriophage probable baseplate hub protein
VGLNPTRAAYRLTANDKDITAAIADRFRSLRLTDETGVESDMLEVTLSDHDPQNRIKRPPKGAELELWLGYDDQVQRMGLFVFDEWERGGWPGYVTFRCRAAVYDETTKGKTDLQTQKARNWPSGTKLGDMVAKIASEHSLQPAVAPALAAIALPHYDQTEESDLSFLLRILKHYDAIVKPAGGKLVVAKRGESKTISGADLPTVTLAVTDLTDWHVNQSEREAPGTVVAYWHSTAQSKRNEVSLGSGDPVKRIRHFFPTEDAATRAAQAELDKRERQRNRFSGTLPGRPDLMAEGGLVLTGFGADDVDGEWVIKRVEHELDAAGGYRCNVEAELPNGAAAPD